MSQKKTRYGDMDSVRGDTNHLLDSRTLETLLNQKLIKLSVWFNDFHKPDSTITGAVMMLL